MSESQCPSLHHLNKSEGETNDFQQKGKSLVSEKKLKTERVVVAKDSISQGWLTFKKAKNEREKRQPQPMLFSRCSLVETNARYAKYAGSKTELESAPPF